MKTVSLDLSSLVILQVCMHRILNNLYCYYYCSYYSSRDKYQVFPIQNTISSSLLKAYVPNFIQYFMHSRTKVIRFCEFDYIKIINLFLYTEILVFFRYCSCFKNQLRLNFFLRIKQRIKEERVFFFITHLIFKKT